MNSIGEFFAKLGFDVDDKKLKQFDEGMKGLGASFLAVVGGAFAAAEAIQAMTADSRQSAQQFHNISEQSGIAEDSIYRLAYAANHFNSSLSFEDAANQAQRIAENIKNIQKGVGDSSGYYWLGIRAKINDQGAVDLDDLTRQMRKAYEEKYALNPMQFTSAAASIGYDPKMLDTLKASNDEFGRTIANAKQSQQIRDANLALANSFNDLSVAINQATQSMVAGLAPALTSLTKSLKEDSPEILAAVGMFDSFLPVLLKLGEALAILKFLGGFEALAVGGTVVGGILAFAAAITTLLGALYEIEKYMKHGRNDITDLIQAVGGKFENTPAAAKKRQLYSAGQAPDYFSPGKKVTMREYFHNLFYGSGTPEDNGGQDEDRLHRKLGELFNQPPAAYTSPIGGNSGTNSTSSHNVEMNNNFYIDSKEDPQTVAKKVDEMLKRNWNHSLSDINNGVTY